MNGPFHDIVCPRCSCLCDDLCLTVAEGAIVSVENACELGNAWWRGQRTANVGGDSFQIYGKDASYSEAVQAAAALLSAARAPLVFGLETCAVPGARAAVELAEKLGAVIDPWGTAAAAASHVAVQRTGVSTATLGEIRQRADLVIYWGIDPARSHPRHLERFVRAPGMFVPEGRAGRRLVVIDEVPGPTAAEADLFLQLDPNDTPQLLARLRAAVQGVACESEGPEMSNFSAEQIEELSGWLTECRTGVIFHGPGLRQGANPHANLESLFRLTAELNARARFNAIGMRSGAGPGVASSVLTWQTGFPGAVSFAGGYPRYLPGEATAELLLARGEADACLLVGSEAAERLSSAARENLAKLPLVIVDPLGATTALAPTVRITTAVNGVHVEGSAARMDGVLLPLRAVLPRALPSDFEAITAISEAAREFPVQ